MNELYSFRSLSQRGADGFAPLLVPIYMLMGWSPSRLGTAPERVDEGSNDTNGAALSMAALNCET